MVDSVDNQVDSYVLKTLPCFLYIGITTLSSRQDGISSNVMILLQILVSHFARLWPQYLQIEDYLGQQLYHISIY